MITLYFFAPVVIAYMGEFLFVIVYFGSLITGSLLTILFHKDDYNYRAVGASGGYFIFRYITATGYDATLFIIPIPAYLSGSFICYTPSTG
jgi:membrane associated rhomboid family serine protease